MCERRVLGIIVVYGILELGAGRAYVQPGREVPRRQEQEAQAQGAVCTQGAAKGHMGYTDYVCKASCVALKNWKVRG